MIRHVVRATCAGLLAVVLVVGLNAMLHLVARPMLYPASPMPVPTPPPSPFEEVRLASDHGEIVAWSAPGRRDDAPAVLLFHGNGENLETMRFSGQLDLWRGFTSRLVAVDYPGYGRSGGSPSEPALVDTGVLACEELATRLEGEPSAPPLVIVGWSLGAAVAVQVAARCDATDGLVLASPWHDLLSLAGEHFPSFLARAALRDRYDSAAAARRLPVDLPTLVLHGTADRIIPIDHGRRLRTVLDDHLGDRLHWHEVTPAGHNDLFTRDDTWRAIRDFLLGL
ncbi:MAG: alpha/beta hydrolase [Acidobacteriota bacterium]